MPALLAIPALILALLWGHARIEDRREIRRMEQSYQVPTDYGAGKPVRWEPGR